MRVRIRSAVACFLPFFFALGMPLGHAQPSPELLQFDDEAAQCRRVVREYCAIVQEMMKDKQLNPAKQEEGLALLKDARTMGRSFGKMGRPSAGGVCRR